MARRLGAEEPFLGEVRRGGNMVVVGRNTPMSDQCADHSRHVGGNLKAGHHTRSPLSGVRRRRV
jgi:hypothetical protein